jgi:phosphoesterase RecJ-like protein
LAMAELLRQRGKEVEIFNASPTPPRYWFMDPGNERVRFQQFDQGLPNIDPDLIIILDTGTWSQLAGLADYVRQSKARKVVIDHHISQDDLGALRLVDTSAAACGILVHEAFIQLKSLFTPESAEALFVAIAMDTGWMRHSNCTPEVFRVQASLMQHGAKPSELYQKLFESNRVERLKLMGVMLERIELLAEGKLAVSKLFWDDIIEAQAHPMETEDFINHPMSIQGVEAVALFIGQREGGTKVSFRSHGGLDCSAMAARFGGGGHRQAAGASMPEPVDDAQKLVLPPLEKTIREL